jgi:hypothetical protein
MKRIIGIYVRELLLIILSLFLLVIFQLTVNLYLTLPNYFEVMLSLVEFIRLVIRLSSKMLRHVLAHGSTALIAPSSLNNHCKLNDNDQSIWNAAYDGLVSLPKWEVASEAEFEHLSKGRKALPTMAIATIKYDAHNCPKQAKYRIVVLGNHDPHLWSKDATAAPVMSQLELKIITSPAVFHRHVLKKVQH